MMLWDSGWVGSPQRVNAFERADKRGMVYLQWRPRGGRVTLSTGRRVRNADGDVDPKVAAELTALALAKAAELALSPSRLPPLVDGLTRCAIYVLIDPRKPDNARYVGQTYTPQTRYRCHLKDNPWARQLVAEGVLPEMRLLEWCDRSEATRRENYWIAMYCRIGQADLNQRIPERRANHLPESDFYDDGAVIA